MTGFAYKGEKYEALNPRGYPPYIELIPLAPRPYDLNDKLVYIINSWREGALLENILAEAAKSLVRHFPRVKVISMDKPSPYPSDDPELWREMQQRGSAFIYGAAPSCSTTDWAITWAAKLEKQGLPGVVVIYNTLIEDAKVACERLGTPIRRVMIPYPPEEVADEQLFAITEDIVGALTRPLDLSELKKGKRQPPRPQMIAVEGTLKDIQDYFYVKGWSDGLPIIPPTEAAVKSMLSGTSHDPKEVITTSMWPEAWEITVEKVAINGVMAGCQPKYLPVLLAAVEAFTSADISTQVRSTNSFSFMQVVNGPIRNEIDMNSGTYALGPGNRANASIGRALRLFIINLGGGQVGVNIMGTQGNVCSYSFCFAENEEESPWESLALEQGFTEGESVISIFNGGWFHTGNYISQPLEDLAKTMAFVEFPAGMVVLLSPPRARLLAHEGYNKLDVKEYLWNHSTATLKRFRASPWYKVFIEPVLEGKELNGVKNIWPTEYLSMPDDAIVPVFPRKSISIIVVGGEVNPMMQGWLMGQPLSTCIDKWR